MKAVPFAVALSLLAAAAQAQNRPSTRTMTCKAVNALVVARGEIVLSTGEGLFDRYVRSQNFCAGSEKATASFEPAADNPGCFVGYRCVPYSDERK